MGHSSSVIPKTETSDLKSNDVEKPEDTKSSPTTNCQGSCAISAKDATFIIAPGNTSKVTDAKASNVTDAKASNITDAKASKVTDAKASKVTDAKASKVTDAKAPEVSKVPSSSQKQVALSAKQGNVPTVSDPKAPEVVISKVPSSSQKQDLPSKCPVLVTPENRNSKDSSESAGTANDQLLSVPDENNKGLRKSVRFSASLDRFWNSIKNIKGSLTSRMSSTVSADHLDKVESESALSCDSTRVESSMFLNQNKLEDILDGYKKRLSVLLVFPKAGKQYKVFCEAIQKMNYFQPSQATNSKGAIVYCKENLFDLIIIDARNKTLLDAKDLCRKLRTHNPRTVIIAVRQRTYWPWPWRSNSDRLASYIAAGFTRDFFENHSLTACQDALTGFEKDVDSMIQLRFLKGLYLAVENCQEAIEISSAHHELQFVNKAYERLLGYSLDEVMGKPWYEMMVSDRNPADQPMKIKQQLDSSNPWEGHNYIKKKSGEYIGNNCRIIPLIEAGKVLQFIGIRKIVESKPYEQKLYIDSPSSSNQSGWPVAGLSDVHSGSRRMSSGLRERMMSITVTQSPHSFSNQNLVNEVTSALAGIRAYQCPQPVYQIIDRVNDMLRSNDRSKNVETIFKEDDELITELIDGLMTTSIPTNVEDDIRGRRRSTFYPGTKSISRMVTRLSEAGNSPSSTFPMSPANQSCAAEIRKLLESVFTWNFNVIRLEEVTNKRPLLYTGLKVFQTFEVYSFLSTDAATFKNWLDVIEQHYNSYNPYHNSTHAADVLQAAASLCRREKIAEMFDDMDVVSTLIAAAIHDLDHPGKTNSFLINSSHRLAILYNDVSVLENHHTALAFRLTFKDNTANIFQKVEKDEYRVLRQQIIDMVLATDMTKHFDYLSRFNDVMRRTSAEVVPVNLGAHVYPVEFRTVVKRMLIKCCDVSNPTRPLESCKIWAERIAEEYCRQTDEEKARGLQVVMPVFDRAKCNIPKTQLSFMNLFILSMMESWNEFCPIPDLMRNLEINFDYWQSIEPTTKEKVVRVVTN